MTHPRPELGLALSRLARLLERLVLPDLQPMLAIEMILQRRGQRRELLRIRHLARQRLIRRVPGRTFLQLGFAVPRCLRRLPRIGRQIALQFRRQGQTLGDVDPRRRLHKVDLRQPQERRAVDQMTARRNPLAERREQLRHPRRQHGPLPFGNSRDNRSLCPLRRLHGQARLAGRHQRTDLVPRERPPQIRQRPPRLEQRRRVIMDVVHQEDAFPQPRDRRLHLRAVKRFPRRGRCSFQSIQHTEFVALGLQPADEPRSTVRQPLVVEVDGVLRRQHHTQSERPRLFEQREHRQLRGRIGRRREVAKHLIHVEHGPQARRAGLRPHPRNHLVQQDRHEEHPLGVRQMRQRQNRQARLPLFRMQQPANIERLALHPRGKAR